MTYARSTLVDSENPGFYHLVSRCVRRAWLCGLDPITSRSYEHRRTWIEERITHLSKIFAVEVFGYAVMSNHYHIVVRLDPNAPQNWSDEDVARRWISISPAKNQSQIDDRVQLMLRDQTRLKECRDRLGSLSWYMRYIKEPIARRANREDNCTGRFWEGRYGSTALLDEDAALSGMVYVDLNPVRAGISIDPVDSRFTSVRKRRVCESKSEYLGPVVSGLTKDRFEFPIQVTRYLKLVEWTARHVHPKSPQQLGCPKTSDWMSAVDSHTRNGRRAIGSIAKLYALAERLGQRWVKGCGQASRAIDRPMLWRNGIDLSN